MIPCLAWAFNSPKHADIKVLFRTSTPTTTSGCDDAVVDVPFAGKNVDKSCSPVEEDASDYASGSRCFFAHRLVLANASAYCQAYLENWAESDTKQRDGLKVLEVPVEEGELEAAEEMLRFMYLGKLSDQCTQNDGDDKNACTGHRCVQHILNVFRLADRFEVVSLSSACADALSKVQASALSVQDANSLRCTQACVMCACVDMHGHAGICRGGCGWGRSPHPPSNMPNTKHACSSCMRVCVQTGDLNFTGCEHEKDQDLLHHNPAAGLID